MIMNSQDILSHLELTFGKIPRYIKENIKYLSYRENTDDFMCNLCNKIIKIVHDNLDTTSLNFEKHLLSVAHQRLFVTEKDVFTQLNVTFGGIIPPIAEKNIMLLDINGCDYNCSICDKIIQVTSNAATTETNFSYHLTSAGHEENLENYRDVVQELHYLYGGIPQVVLNHKQFLSKIGKHYNCKICDKQIMVHPTSICETEKSFEKHLHSLKHMRIAKQENAFSLIPQLKNIFNPLPRHMLESIEYVSVNGFNFFCLLCNENIKVSHENNYETQLNFKVHIQSATHEEKLNNRRNSKSEPFQLIEEHFDEAPTSVMDNLKYLSIDEENYYCKICHHTIFENDYSNHNLSSHFESSHHIESVENEMNRQDILINELEELFGCLPELIDENMSHIMFSGSNQFQCLLCNKIMMSKTSGDDYESNANPTEKTFANHLESVKHCDEIDDLEEIEKDVLTDLKELFFPIPQFIMNNLEHIHYSNDDFCCFLCDKVIKIVNGNKKGELTEQNFRNHFLSVGHLAKLKQKANQTMEATDKLEAIFNNVPNFILVNIEYIELNGQSLNCTLCDAEMVTNIYSSTLEEDLRRHLLGRRHKSNLEDEENCIDEAFERIDRSFVQVPELILKNIDFLSTTDDDCLFCMLCQINLPLDANDIMDTRNELYDHFESSFHKNHLKSL